MRVARRFLVSGRVQGVGFRYFTQDIARREGLTGRRAQSARWPRRSRGRGRRRVARRGSKRHSGAGRRTRASKHVEVESIPPPGATPGSRSASCSIAIESRDHDSWTPQSQDSPRAGLSQARHPLLRHHDAAERSAGVPRHDRRAGGAVSPTRASSRSSASRAAASFSAPPSPTQLDAGLRADSQAGQAPVEDASRGLRARIRHRRPRDSRRRVSPRPAGAAGGRRAGDRRHGARPPPDWSAASAASWSACRF